VATLGMTEAERQAIEAFKHDVIEPSMTSLVILDFWAEWCGPCKALTPVLEKVAAKYADKGVVLKKINVDEQKLVAAQFRIQSIPTVYALFEGQLVADLTPARTESQLSQMLDQILRQLPIKGEAGSLAEDIAPMIAMAEEALEAGEVEQALSVFGQLAEMAPDNADALSGYARALVKAGLVDEAETALATLPPEREKEQPIARARAAIALAKDAQPVDDLAALKTQVAANPDDFDARYELAGGLMAAGDRDGAAEALLDLIARDRNWNEGAARQRLLKLLEVVGLEDPWVRDQRRKLSAILFT
jgi:putative thioredoxin